MNISINDILYKLDNNTTFYDLKILISKKENILTKHLRLYVLKKENSNVLATKAHYCKNYYVKYISKNTDFNQLKNKVDYNDNIISILKMGYIVDYSIINIDFINQYIVQKKSIKVYFNIYIKTIYPGILTRKIYYINCNKQDTIYTIMKRFGLEYGIINFADRNIRVHSIDNNNDGEIVFENYELNKELNVKYYENLIISHNLTPYYSMSNTICEYFMPEYFILIN